MRNGYIERFNVSYREGVRDTYELRNLVEARGRTQAGYTTTTTSARTMHLAVFPRLRTETDSRAYF
jgi:hypothetical protein